VAHRHFQVNGKTVDKPSMIMRPGDVISVRNRPNLKTMYAALADSISTESCDWLTFDKQDLTATVAAAPTYEDVSLPVNVGQVVALISR
jgi:small subunit ribosomal protein S4